MPALIAYIDTSFRYRFNNQTYEKWLGEPQESIPGRHVREVLGETAWESLRPYMEAAAAGPTVHFEAQVNYRRLGPRWIDGTYNSDRDPSGAVRGFAVLVNDITPQKQAEQALRHCEESQQLLVALRDATRGLLDPQQVMWEVVLRVGRHFGVSRCAYGEIDPAQQHVLLARDYTFGVRSVVGRHRLDDFGPEIIRDLKAGQTVAIADIREDPRTSAPAAVAAYEAIDTQALVAVPLVKGERLVAILAVQHMEPYAWTNADVVLLEQIAQRTWFAVDSARSQAALRESRDVLSLAMRGGRMGAWSRDLATNAVWWSRELEEIFGLPPGGFTGTEDAFFALVHDEDRPHLKAAVEAAVASGSDYTIEFRFRHASGEWRWMEGRGRAVYTPEGRPAILYGLGIDITERRQAEDALREADRRKDEFLTRMLALLGHTVRVARDGEEALAVAAEFTPEVILLDIGLPKLHGYEVARHLRTLPWSAETAIVAQTGWGQEDDKRRALDAGFDHHLTKQVDLAALTELLEDLAAQERSAPPAARAGS